MECVCGMIVEVYSNLYNDSSKALPLQNMFSHHASIVLYISKAKHAYRLYLLLPLIHTICYLYYSNFYTCTSYLLLYVHTFIIFPIYYYTSDTCLTKQRKQKQSLGCWNWVSLLTVIYAVYVLQRQDVSTCIPMQLIIPARFSAHNTTVWYINL